MRIIFSQKQLSSLLKQQIESDELESDKAMKENLLQLWNDGQHQGFIDELQKISDQNIWKIIKPDLVSWHKVFNVIDEILAYLLGPEDVQAPFKINHENLQSTLIVILKFIKLFIQSATNVQYFNSIEYMTLIFKRFPTNYQLREEVMSILISISAKQTDKKNQQQLYSDHFKTQMSEIMPSIKGLILNLDFIADLLVKDDSMVPHTDTIQQFIDIKKQADSSQEAQVQIHELSNMQQALYEKVPLEDIFLAQLRAINQYINVGENIGIQQSARFEHMLPPQQTITKFIKLLNTPSVEKKVQNQTINIMFLLIILDLNQIFNYVQPQDNQYYVEACKHHDFYIQLIATFAKYHAYDKLLPQTDTSSFIQNTEMDAQLAMIKPLIEQTNEMGESQSDIQQLQVTDMIKSQRVLNSFLNFMNHLLNIKNRAIQSQMYPQFLKPLLAIVSVKPVNYVYHININCQVKAAKLLKDVVKHVSIEDPGAVEKILQRLKYELSVISEDENKWLKAEDDDTESNILLMYKQDLIRTCLRFLCYSIIRNDPNAINFNQNFIANSRKILDSEIIQNELSTYVFDQNSENQTQQQKKAIDPIILQCIQLVSYVFNDLPQKIQQFLDNNILPSIVNSLVRRMPIQVEAITLLVKFFQTICLNPDGTKLIISSKIIDKFIGLSRESKAHRHIFLPQTPKGLTSRDLIQQFCLVNQEIADQFYSSVLENFLLLKEKAWEVTNDYIVMEDQCNNNTSLSAENKTELRKIYEKKQNALDLCFESAANFLWYFTSDSSNYGSDNIIEKAISSNKNAKDIFLQIIATPIVASACPNMFLIFIDVLTQILKLLDGKTEEDFISTILSFLEKQMENVYLLIRSQDFDNVQDLSGQISASDKITLAEIEENQQYQKLMFQLNGDDQISITFGKVSFYCDILKGDLSTTKQQMIIKENHTSLITQLFKVQSLVNRYHAAIYERDLLSEDKRLKEFTLNYGQMLQDFDFTNFVPIEEPSTEFDDAKNLWFKYNVDKVKSLNDSKARVSNKTVIELQLDDNLSNTSNMCQQSIRRLIISLLKTTNRQKLHFTQAADKNSLNFQKTMGKLIAEEFSEFVSSQKNEQSINEIYIKKMCCQHSAILSEFNRALFQNYTTGYLITEFIAQNGIDYIEGLSTWMVKIVTDLDQQESLKTVSLCKHIQLLWSHIIDFYSQFLEGKYFETQFNHILIAFKTNPLARISSEDSAKEHEQAVTKLKKYFMNYYVRCYSFLYKEQNKDPNITSKNMSVFEFYDKYSELFFSTLVDLYIVLCKGLTNSKPFDVSSNLDQNQGRLGQNIQHTRNYQQLAEMGFDQQSIENALEDTRNNMGAALQILLNMPQTNQIDDKSVKATDKINKKQVDQQFKGIDINTQYTYDNVLLLIEYSLPYFLKFNAANLKLVNKVKIIETLFFTLGSDYKNPSKERFLINLKNILVQFIQKSIKNKNFSQVGLMASSLECILRYRKANLLEIQDIFKTLNIINVGFSELIKLFKEKVQWRNQEMLQQNDQQALEFLKQIDSCLSLILYIAEETKSISDFNKLSSIISAPNTNGSLPVVSLASSLHHIQDKIKDNIFGQNKADTANFLTSVSLQIIELFNSLHNVSSKCEEISEFPIQKLLHHSIFLLNSLINIKGFGDFDCQSIFLKNEGLKALFGIKIINDTFKFQSPKVADQKKYSELINQSKILLQQLCINEQSQVKVYENLIKSILFIQFQERYKKEEGKDVKSLMTQEEQKQLVGSMSKQQPSTTKNKKPNTPIMKSQSMDIQSNNKNQSKQQEIMQSKNQAKFLKQLFKKNEYCEVLLTEFIEFFNNVKLITDLKAFLMACSNICVIKSKAINQKKKMTAERKLSKDQDEEEKKEKSDIINSEVQSTKPLSKKKQSHKKKAAQHEDDIDAPSEQEQVEQTQENQSYITLNNATLKDMVIQLFSNNIQNKQSENEHGSKGTPQLQNKQFVQKFQQDIIFTILDQFIEQIRDHQMLILQASKSKTNPTIQGIQCTINNQGQLLISSKEEIKSNKYIFDYISLLEHLTFVINHQPSLVSAILKHKDGKTFRFIVRNLYFIMTLHTEKVLSKVDELESNEQQKDVFRIWSEQKNEDKRWKDIITDFFKRVVPDTPHLSSYDKKIKIEARQLMFKEILKNLIESQVQNKYPQWPQARLIFNSGTIWLISCVLAEEEHFSGQGDKNTDELIKNMQKYRNIMKNNMIKLLISDAQSSQKTDQPHQGFVLLKLLENIYNEIIENKTFYGTIKGPLDNCMASIVNILRPFEQKAIWGLKEGELSNENDIIENSLGFMDLRGDDASIIDEEEDDDDNEEDDDDDDDTSEEDDDELLDSDPSERNFRISENDDDEEYGDEIEEEFIISEGHDDDQDSSNFANNEQDQDIEIELIDDGYGDEYGSQDDQFQGDLDMIDESGQDHDSHVQSASHEHPDDNQEHQGSNHDSILQVDPILDEDEDIEDESNYTGEYDEELEDDDEESYGESDETFTDNENEEGVEIYIGRDQNNIDRISIMDENGQSRANANRRDIDLISFNNLSMDMLNLGGDGGHHHRRANEDESQNDSQQQENQVRVRHDNHFHFGRRQNGDITGFINNILEVLGGSSNNNQQQIRDGLEFTHEVQQQQDDILHDPTLVIKDILDLKRHMQQSEELFKNFIGETQPLSSPFVRETSLSLQPAESHHLRHQEQDQKQKSQFSGQNPLSKNKQQQSQSNQQSAFGQLQTNIFNLDQSNANTNDVPAQLDQQILPVQHDSEQINTSSNPLNDEDRIFQEFLTNLDEEAKQNIADTENIMNNIRNQTTSDSQTVTNIQQLLERASSQEQRQQILRNLPDHDLNQLPSNLFSEALVLRQLAVNQDNAQERARGHRYVPNAPFLRHFVNLGPLDAQTRQNLARGGRNFHRNHVQQTRNRFISFDSQLNDIAGVQRDTIAPFQKPGTRSPQVSPFTLRQNNLFSNVVNFLSDELIEMDNRIYYDSKGNDLHKHCETILMQNLTNCHENIEVYYSKIRGLIGMTMSWIIMNFSSKPNGIIDKFMIILLKMPLFRQGLLTNIYFYLQQGVQQFSQFVSEIKNTEQAFQEIQKFTLKEDRIDLEVNYIDDFVIENLTAFNQILTYVNKISNWGVFDLLKKPDQDDNLSTFLNAIKNDHGQLYEQHNSLLEQIINQIIEFDKLANTVPRQTFSSQNQEQSYHLWDEQLVQLLQNIFYNIQIAFDRKQPDGQQLPQSYQYDSLLVQKVGDLILKKDLRGKKPLSNVKKIFNIFVKSPNCLHIVRDYFKNSLNTSLKRFINHIKEPKLSLDKIQQEVGTINLILRISKVLEKSESNICDEDQYFEVVDEVSKLLEQKSNESNQLSTFSFVFKEEFKAIMMVLTILFEYNLRYIFIDSDEGDLQTKKRQSASLRRSERLASTTSGVMKASMQDVDQIQKDSQSQGIKNDNLNIMEQIDLHLQNKIKDPKIREDKRLKVFIKFCLEHKKLINSFIRANQQVLNQSIRNVIMKVPQILDFDNKRLLFRSQIKKMQKKYRLKYLDLRVRRDKIFDDSYQQLKDTSVDRWKGKMNVDFADEQGIDEGGLSREWFILISQEIFNADLALFVQSNAGSTYYPNPKSTVQNEYKQLFQFIGRIVGKALYEQQLLDCYFVKAFYKIILGLPLTIYDVEDYDNELYKSLKWFLENNVDGTGLTFTETVDYFGENKEIELIPGGKDIEITEQNKFEYVQKMAYHKLYLSIQKQMDSFLKGFYEIIPKDIIQIFDFRELELLVSGLPTIDIEDLKENTIYTNYTSESNVIKWLWEVLEEFDNSERAEFIQFVTGSSKVPVEGFKGLRGSRGIQKFQIVKIFSNDHNRLPQAHTCFKQLELPEYISKDNLKDRLITAVKEGKVFGFA